MEQGSSLNPDKIGFGSEVVKLSIPSQMYATGTGTDQNDLLALKWAFLSKYNYDSDRYDKGLKDIADRLPLELIEKAECLALEWIETTGAIAQDFPGFLRNPILDYLAATR